MCAAFARAGNLQALWRALSSRLCAVPLIALLYTSSYFQSSAPTVGHVYAAEGDWRLVSFPGRPLGRGDAIAVTDSIRVPASSSEGATIVLWLPAGRMVCTATGQVTCLLANGQKAACIKPAGNAGRAIIVADCLKASASAQEIRVFTAVLKWVREEPRRFIPLLSRAPGYATEAVLLHEPSGTNLASVLVGLAPGEYRICARVLGSKTSAQQPAAVCSIVGAVTWVAGKPTVLAGAWAPGLYEVAVSSDLDRQNAWVLVAAGAAHQQLSGDFARATQIAATWPDPVDRTEVRTFLRAFLMNLANPQSR